MPIMHLLAPKLKKSFLQQIENIVGLQGYSTKPLHRLNYSRDSSFRSTIQIKYNFTEFFPDLIVWPQNGEQVQKLIRLAGRSKMPVVPFGAGSGVCGGTIPVKGGMVVDVKRLNRVLRLDAQNLQVTVEAGMMLQHLEDELARNGYTLGHFPSSILCCSLGGCLAARSAGQLSSRYGKIEDMVRDLELVTGCGELLQTRFVNNTSGIDLNQVFLGSEGTLGIFTKATLRIYPLSPCRRFRGIKFRDMQTSFEAIRRIMQSGIKPAVVRLYDPLDTLMLHASKGGKDGMKMPEFLVQMQETLKMASLKMGLIVPQSLQAMTKLLPTGCMVIFMHEGHEKIVGEEVSLVYDICHALDGEDCGEEPAQQWFKTRYRVSYNASPLFYSGTFTDTVEVAATWDRMHELYKKMLKAMSPHCMVMAHLSHVYADGGSLYFTFLAPLKGLQASVKTYDRIWDKAMKTCQELGAAISHHHGIGRLKAKFMETEWGRGDEIFYRLKDLYDPHGILNPGKLFLEKQERGKKAA